MIATTIHTTLSTTIQSITIVVLFIDSFYYLKVVCAKGNMHDRKTVDFIGHNALKMVLPWERVFRDRLDRHLCMLMASLIQFHCPARVLLQIRIHQLPRDLPLNISILTKVYRHIYLLSQMIFEFLRPEILSINGKGFQK